MSRVDAVKRAAGHLLVLMAGLCGAERLTGQYVVSNNTTITSPSGAGADLVVVNNATMTITGSNASWNTGGGTAFVGSSFSIPGNGNLNLSSGGKLFSVQGGVAAYSGSTGAVTVNGSGSLWYMGNSLGVGIQGTGSLTIENAGAVTAVGTVVIGDAPTGSGAVAISGSGASLATSANPLYVGLNGTGALTLSDGGSVVVQNGSGTLVVAANSGAHGTVNVGADAAGPAAAAGIVDAAVVSGGGGTATLQFNTTGTAGAPTYFSHDGTANTAGVAIIGSTKVVNTAGYTVISSVSNYYGGTLVAGGTLQFGTGGVSGTLSGNVTNNGTLAYDVSDAGLTLSGIVSGSGSLNVLGGKLILTNADTYTGTTTISAGTLALGAGGSLANTAEIMIADGATFDVSASGFTLGNGQLLGGAGSVVGAFVAGDGSTIAPGSPAGTLTFEDGLTLEAGSILEFQLGSASDLIAVGNGTLTGPDGGTVTLNLSDAGDFDPLTGATFTLFDFSGASTENFDIADFVVGTLPAGTTPADYSFGLSAGALTLTYGAASAVPEPASWAVLVGAAAFGCAFARRRRRNGRRP